MQREGMVGRIGFTFLPSWVTVFAVSQPADSPINAAPLCWLLCLCPRELVGPAGLCAQVLGRRCRCGPWQAIRPLISQSSSFVLGMCKLRLQWLWLGTPVRAAGGSSRFGSVTLFCARSAQPADQSSRQGLERWRAGGGFSRLGVTTLASPFVLGKCTSSRPYAW